MSMIIDWPIPKTMTVTTAFLLDTQYSPLELCRYITKIPLALLLPSTGKDDGSNASVCYNH